MILSLTKKTSKYKGGFRTDYKEREHVPPFGRIFTNTRRQSLVFFHQVGHSEHLDYKTRHKMFKSYTSGNQPHKGNFKWNGGNGTKNTVSSM